MRETLARNGLASAMNYYKVYHNNVNLTDHQGADQSYTRSLTGQQKLTRSAWIYFGPLSALPEAAWHVTKPVLYIAAKRDFVCQPVRSLPHFDKYAPHREVVELDTGHWVQLEDPAGVNAALEEWLQRLP